MANEITATVSVAFAKGNIPSQTFPASFSVTVSGSNYMRTVQTVGTSAEAMTLGDVATPGVAIIHNLDGTNFVTVAANNTDAPAVKIKAGETWPFRISGTTPFLQADTAPVQVEFLVISD